METVNIQEAKTHLSRLIEKAAKGEPFIIADAGKPLVKVTAVEAAAESPPGPVDTSKRFGFMKGEKMIIPEDFDRFAEDEIAEMFGVKP